MMCRMCRKRRQRLITPETCKARDLYRDDGFTIKELFLSGFKLADLRDVGISVKELRTEGIGALEFRRAGYTPAVLRRAGVKCTELRACGYSLADLRLAGFSDGAVAETNRLLRTFISCGNLSLLPQNNPSSPRTMLGTGETLKALPFNHPLRLMTPLIREHTDWNGPEGQRKAKSSLGAAGASIVTKLTVEEETTQVAIDEDDD